MSQNTQRPPTQSAASQAASPARSGETVTVACKVPNGMRLRLFGHRIVRVPVLGGGVAEEKQAYQIGESIVVNGPKWPVNQPMPDFRIVGNAGITSGVPKEFWDKWVEQNEEHDAYLNRMIFAMPTEDAAVGRAKEEVATRSGAEPMLQDKDPRRPRPLNANLSEITKDDGKKDAA